MKGIGRFRSLGTQLIIYFMIISIAVMSAASYYIYSYMLGMMKDQNERFLLQQFQQHDYNIQGLVNEIDRLSKLFLLDASTQRFLQNATNTNLNELEQLELKKDIYKRIEDFISNYNYIHSIYIISGTQGVVGSSGSRTLVQSESEWSKQFFTSDGFHKSVKAFPDMVFEGGVNHSYYNPYISPDHDGKVISVIRSVRPIYEPLTNATLVFNIDERYFASIYAAAPQEEDGEMYVVNEQGAVVSSSNPASIGNVHHSAEWSAEAKKFGSYDVGKGDTPVQIVYYKLKSSNWYMMKEIPIYQFSTQIFTVQRMIILVFLISLVIMFVVTYFWLKRMIKPLHILSLKMKDMSRGELGVTFPTIPNNEFGTVIRRFNEMSLSIVELIKKNDEIQEKKREIEIEALQYQINPHFLYNTLNMIRWMASIIKADNIVNSIVALGNILRPAFASTDTMCTLRDELSYLENYIKIINWRFSSSVVFSFDVKEQYLESKVPRFILQPLIENSITFGRQGEGHAIEIHIEVYEEAEDFMISVVDSGIGIESDRLEQLNQRMKVGEHHTAVKSSGNGIGLYNVNKRIQLNFGDKYGLKLVQNANGAEVRVRLPKLS